MPSPATVADVEARWRLLSTEETFKAQALLGDAWALLTHRVNAIEARLVAVPATLDVKLAVMVQVAMVLRVLRNPDAKQAETIQDYSYQRTAVSASGELMVTADELDLLALAGTSPDVFTITPYSLPWDAVSL